MEEVSVLLYSRDTRKTGLYQELNFEVATTEELGLAIDRISSLQSK